MLARLEWNANGSLGLHNRLIGRRCRDPLICLSCQHGTAELLTPFLNKKHRPLKILCSRVIRCSPWHLLPQGRSVWFSDFSGARALNGDCHDRTDHPALGPKVASLQKQKQASFPTSFGLPLMLSYVPSVWFTACNEQMNYCCLIRMFCLMRDQDKNVTWG